MRLVVGFAWLVVLFGATVARADYPRALIERPLVLPAGTVEGALAYGLETRTDDVTSFATARTTYGDGRLDLEFASTLVVDPDAAHPERLSIARLASRYEAVRDLAVTTSVAYGASTLSTRAGIAHRRVRGPGGIELHAHAGLDDGLSTIGVVGGGLYVRAQLAPLWGLEGRASFAYLHDGHARKPELRHRFAQDFGARVVVSVTPAIDAIAAVELLAFSDDVKLFTVGAVLRGVP